MTVVAKMSCRCYDNDDDSWWDGGVGGDGDNNDYGVGDGDDENDDGIDDDKIVV